jgi:hypothetical protein
VTVNCQAGSRIYFSIINLPRTELKLSDTEKRMMRRQEETGGDAEKSKILTRQQ